MMLRLLLTNPHPLVGVLEDEAFIEGRDVEAEVALCSESGSGSGSGKDTIVRN